MNRTFHTHHTRMAAAVLALILAAGAAACGKQSGTGSNADTSSAVADPLESGRELSGGTGNSEQTASPETAPEIHAVTEPVAGDYTPTEETVIRLGETVSIEGDGAAAQGGVVTIGRAGSYVISGTTSNGQIVVDTADTGKVTLIFNGVSLSSPDGPAVYIKSAPKKAVLYSAAGSVNLLSDGENYVVPDEAQTEGEIYPNACVYACEDLELDGLGELHITGRADKGINTKDDLKIKGGTVVVTAAGVGIRANDSLDMSGGSVTITAGGDGIKTANTETQGKGHAGISGGALYVTAKGDGVSAATDLAVTGGTLVLTTTDEDGVILPESTGHPTTSGSSGGMGGFGGPSGRPGGFGESSSDKAAISAKGLKAGGNLSIGGGKITIAAQDDGLHAGGDIVVSGGSLHIRAADDGMHADGDLTISGGVNEVAQSYEGLEALHIAIAGGTNRITASDDGANATDGTGSGFGGPGGPGGGFGGAGGGRPGMPGGSSGSVEFSEDQPCLTFAGGYTIFNAAGDGIDSNGWIKMTGGTVLVYGPTDNGNGPIDFGDGGYNMAISGGTFLAVGSSGMAETAENEGQAVLAAYWNRTGLSAGDVVGIADADGRVLAAFVLPKAIASVVFSSPDLSAGKTYTMITGGTYGGTAADGVIDVTTYGGFESIGEIEAY